MVEIEESERLRRQMIEVSPYRVGHRVTISPDYIYAGDWPGEYVIVSLTWEYNRGDGHGINVGIASDDDIINRNGYTDGFKINDLSLVTRS